MKTGVLVASVSRNAGGLFESVRWLARWLHNPPQCDIQVFSLQDKYTNDDLAAWGGLTVNVFPVHGPRSWGYAPRLGSALQSAVLDLLHVHGVWMYPSVASLQWARRKSKPYMLSSHGMLDTWAREHSRWKKFAAGRLYENAHLHGAACLRALCEAEAQAMREYGLRNPICVIPNGIELAENPYLNGYSPHRRSPDGQRVLLYLGRLHPKKGLEHLLRGWDLARRGNPGAAEKWQLVIAGWDQAGHLDKLKALCRELRIQDSVRFLGPQFGQDKHDTYSSADAFIVPSFSEGLPMVVLEAWAYNLPVLMTPQCNLPEGFRAGAAMQIDPDQHSIARGLGSLFSMSDAQRQAIGTRGRQLVERHFSWSNIAADMQRVYEWMLGGGAPPNSVMTD